MKLLPVCLSLLLTVGCVARQPVDSASSAEVVTPKNVSPPSKPEIAPQDLAVERVSPSPAVPAKVERQETAVQIPASEPDGQTIQSLCQEIGSKLGSVSMEECLARRLQHGGYTTQNRSLAYKDYLPFQDQSPLGRVMLIGGIHGDEYSSVSVVFKWMEILDQHHSGLFHWRFIPSTNPDGLLREKSQRQNHNGVDLNRNFPTRDWDVRAQDYWVDKTNRNPRRRPGISAASEIETRWLVEQIREFDPDVIISMHAPYHLVDYDGPPKAPDRLGGLYLRRLGVYPGSLGNYAGIDLQLPVVTVELKSAGIMPSPGEISVMWLDLVAWLRQQLKDGRGHVERDTELEATVGMRGERLLSD